MPRDKKNTKSETTRTRRPLLLGTSGGGGHNSAIEAIANDLEEEGVELPLHTAPLLRDKKLDASSAALWIGSCLLNDVPLVREGIGALTSLAHLPILPDRESLHLEMQSLESGQKDSQGQPKKRRYIDVLLDVFNAGYLFVAIYNILHKTLSIQSQKGMVSQQELFDKFEYKHVKQFFLNKLNEAHKKGEPYTEVISSQVVALGAICDAVIQYNRQHPKETIQVHQYLTDIATKGATHYISPLLRLSAKARTVVHLHGINIKKSTALFGKAPFAGIHEIDSKNNPMVRKGFKNRDELARFRLDHQEVRNLPIQQEGKNETNIAIQPGDKIASIMFSSVGGDESLNYAERLAKVMDGPARAYDKIFVFCGKNNALKARLQQLQIELEGRRQWLGLPEPI